MKRTCFLAALLLAFSIALPDVIVAQQARDHDRGFFVRLSAGYSDGQIEYDDPDGRVERSVDGLDGNFAVGAIVVRNLAAHGSLFANGDFSAIGGGLTYYFMPINAYVSVSAGAASFKDVSPYGDTSGGPAFDLTLGKEWWTGDRWAIGVAGAFEFYSLNGNLEDNRSGSFFAVRFTATMN